MKEIRTSLPLANYWINNGAIIGKRIYLRSKNEYLQMPVLESGIVLLDQA
jgi:hypothetical protein